MRAQGTDYKPSLVPRATMVPAKARSLQKAVPVKSTRYASRLQFAPLPSSSHAVLSPEYRFSGRDGACAPGHESPAPVAGLGLGSLASSLLFGSHTRSHASIRPPPSL